MYSIVHPYGHDDQNMHAYMRWEFEALQKVLIPMIYYVYLTGIVLNIWDVGAKEL